MPTKTLCTKLRTMLGLKTNVFAYTSIGIRMSYIGIT